MFDGSMVTRNDEIRLKHLSSDTYFTIGEYKDLKNQDDTKI